MNVKSWIEGCIKLICGGKAAVPHWIVEQTGKDAEKVICDPKLVFSKLLEAADSQSSSSPPIMDVAPEQNFMNGMTEQEVFTFLIDSYRLR